ncbi:MAG: hypothetical protein ACJ72F_02175 [Nitrososphaeraceae archaeon]|jgi:hypothetical protein
MILIQQDAHYVINNDVMARTIKDNLSRNIVEGFFAEYLYVLYLLMKDKPIVAYEGEVCIDETRHAILLFLKISLMTYQGTENPILELRFLR